MNININHLFSPVVARLASPHCRHTQHARNSSRNNNNNNRINELCMSLPLKRREREWALDIIYSSYLRQLSSYPVKYAWMPSKPDFVHDQDPILSYYDHVYNSGASSQLYKKKIEFRPERIFLPEAVVFLRLLQCSLPYPPIKCNANEDNNRNNDDGDSNNNYVAMALCSVQVVSFKKEGPGLEPAPDWNKWFLYCFLSCLNRTFTLFLLIT